MLRLAIDSLPRSIVTVAGPPLLGALVLEFCFLALATISTATTMPATIQPVRRLFLAQGFFGVRVDGDASPIVGGGVDLGRGGGIDLVGGGVDRGRLGFGRLGLRKASLSLLKVASTQWRIAGISSHA